MYIRQSPEKARNHSGKLIPVSVVVSRGEKERQICTRQSPKQDTFHSYFMSERDASTMTSVPQLTL